MQEGLVAMGTIAQYSHLMMMFLAAAFIGGAALMAGALMGPKKRGTAKLEAYESGNPVEGNARERFPVHFYLVGMLFILFDIETAFLFPLAVTFQSLPQFLFVQAIIFIGVLGVGYVYIFRKGVLKWK
jgi:NADH-quinone oxidoreductase subunit A